MTLRLRIPNLRPGSGRATLILLVAAMCCRFEIQADEPKHTNRLISESSPYLLQHAHNPVDWYPWGDDAFAKAKRENKMVFLSVGYAACHWCHVMERETFEDEEIAKYLNENFVCIKVDREERPDVDQIYMTAVQMISGNGGWPMSMFLMPDARPFWGGTYFPARTGDRGNATGFFSIVKQVQQAWKEQPETIAKQCDHVTNAIREQQKISASDASGHKTPDLNVVKNVFESLSSQFDPEFGGFRFSSVNPNRPKFPEPSNLVFLIDRLRNADGSVPEAIRQRAKTMLVKTLDGMVVGAMYDHIGGAFHRYSVDRFWQIPHFEKMLYDNGQLASVFAEAYELTGHEDYRVIATRTCEFVIDHMTAPGGGFFSSLDADSEGEEGKFYRWTREELAEASKSVPQYEAYAALYRLDQPPTFEEEFFVPHTRRPLRDLARDKQQSVDQLLANVESQRKALWEIREKRVAPPTDTKVLTGWNGLMIQGLADAGRIFKRDGFVDAASKAAEFIETKLVDDRGRLLRTHAAGQSKLNGYIDDYAFYVAGLLALHRATEEPKWLEMATRWTEKTHELFWDKDSGGYFFTTHDHPSLIVRTKDPIDGAVPSGASVTLQNLSVLGDQTDDADQKKEYEARIQSTLKSMSPYFDQAPAGLPRAATVLAKQQGGS